MGGLSAPPFPPDPPITEGLSAPPYLPDQGRAAKAERAGLSPLAARAARGSYHRSFGSKV